MMRDKDLPDGWKVVELAELIECLDNKRVPLNSEQRSKIQGQIPYYGANGQLDSINQYLFDEKLLLLAEDGGSWGLKQKCAYQINGKSWVNNHAHVLRMKESTCIGYLMHFLNYSDLNKYITGTTRGKLNRKSMEKINVLLPPLQTQKKIVAILEKAERLKEWRKEADELTDEFLKSTFLEMFGDLDKQNKGWEMSNLKDVCDELYRYPTFYGFDYLEKGVPIVRIMNILLNGSLDPNISNYVFFDPLLNKKFPRTILEFNDIVMAVRGDGSTAKRIGLVDNMNITGANISPNLIRFKANKKLIHPLYLFKFMTSDVGQTLLQKSVTRTAKKNITAGNIKKIPVPLPPLPLQQKFASIVQQVEQLREYQSQSRQHIDDLFNVLMQKAFKGDLI